MQRIHLSLLIVIGSLFFFVPSTNAEWYVGGQAGYVKPNDLKDVEGTGSASGISLSDLELKDAFGYGAKVGYFFENLEWLGVEFETFTANPHIKKQNVTASLGGSSVLGTLSSTDFRIIVPAVNVIVRYPGYYVEPYAGAGLGVFFAKISDSGGKDNDVSPGVNAIAGLRFYVNEDWGIFTEYKYNYAHFKFDDALIEADYSSHGIYGGVSFHF